MAYLIWDLIHLPKIGLIQCTFPRAGCLMGSLISDLIHLTTTTPIQGISPGQDA